MHATAFLKDREHWTPRPVVVVVGAESHLKQAVLQVVIRRTLGDEEGNIDCSRYPGNNVEWRAIRDELLTVSMFSPARVVVIEDADDFVSQNRASIEDYFGHPARKSVLVLEVRSWPKNTRLAKALPDVGIDVECVELTGASLQRWLVDEAASQHHKQLSREAGSLMVELVGSGMSLLAQELEKLTAYVGNRDRITVDDVRTLVGGWRAETTWEMLDAVREGRSGAALHSLDRLLTAGEPAPKLLGGVNYGFRKLAEATERARQGTPLRAALQQSGVHARDIDSAERYLRRIGRQRAERILNWLADADADLKGRARLSDRLLLERLILNLCGLLPSA